MPHYKSTHFDEHDNPVWLGDDRTRDHVLPGGATLEAGAFDSAAGFDVVAAEAATGGDTTLAVEPLDDDIAAGVTLRFDANKFATLAEPAHKGDTELTTEALDSGIDAGDTARHNPHGRMRILASTPVGRTQAEAAAGDPFGPAEPTDDEVFLVLITVQDAYEDPTAELLRPGSLVYSDKMPVWDDLSSDVQDLIRDEFQVMTGTP